MSVPSKNPVALAALALGLAACAQSYQPIVDMGGVDQARYQRDLAACRQYAEQVNPAGEVIAGAVLGAALGAALGAVTGSFDSGIGSGASAAAGAAYGGTLGVAGGAANGVGGQIEVIRNCLRGRGYNVLR